MATKYCIYKKPWGDIEAWEYIDDLEDVPYYEEIVIPGVEFKRSCPMCGEFGAKKINLGDELGGIGYLCKQCFDKHYFYCDSCGKIELKLHRLVDPEGQSLCKQCQKTVPHVGFLYEIFCSSRLPEISGITNTYQEAADRIITFVKDFAGDITKLNAYIMDEDTGEIVSHFDNLGSVKAIEDKIAKDLQYIELN